ncbi:hypothetical protein JCM21900_006419 [Sporobolomyces salmonicolor]
MLRSSRSAAEVAASPEAEDVGMGFAGEEHDDAASSSSDARDEGEDSIMLGDDDYRTTAGSGPSLRPHAAASSRPPRSIRPSAAPGPSNNGPSRSRRAGGKERGMSNFERERMAIERRGGGGGGGEDEVRQGAEQNVWEKVLDRNGYPGQLDFDPFWSQPESPKSNAGDAATSTTAPAAPAAAAFTSL